MEASLGKAEKVTKPFPIAPYDLLLFEITLNKFMGKEGGGANYMQFSNTEQPMLAFYYRANYIFKPPVEYMVQTINVATKSY